MLALTIPLSLRIPGRPARSWPARAVFSGSAETPPSLDRLELTIDGVHVTWSLALGHLLGLADRRAAARAGTIRLHAGASAVLAVETEAGSDGRARLMIAGARRRIDVDRARLCDVLTEDQRGALESLAEAIAAPVLDAAGRPLS